MKNVKDHGPNISLPVLGTVCFVTLLMCQIRFKITRELSHEALPPAIMRSKECWFLYTIGKAERLQYIMRTFMVMSSPLISLFSSAVLLFGKTKSNPYYFIPWLFLTLKGLLLVQTDNLISIFKDMMSMNYEFGSRLENMKWLLFYFTFFMIDLVEAFSFCEIFDLFLQLWNHPSKLSEETMELEGVKKDLADVLENLSRCSLMKSSKTSMENILEDESLTKNDSDKSSDEKALDERYTAELFKKCKIKNELGENISQKTVDLPISVHSQGDVFFENKGKKEKLPKLSKNPLFERFANEEVSENIPSELEYKNYYDKLGNDDLVNNLFEEIWSASDCMTVGEVILKVIQQEKES